MTTRDELNGKSVKELRTMKKELKVPGNSSTMTKADLINAILDTLAMDRPVIPKTPEEIAEEIASKVDPLPKPVTTEKKTTKYGLLRKAFEVQTTWTWENLVDYTGFDKKNLAVAVSILKNPARTKDILVIEYDRITKTYTLVED